MGGEEERRGEQRREAEEKREGEEERRRGEEERMRAQHRSCLISVFHSNEKLGGFILAPRLPQAAQFFSRQKTSSQKILYYLRGRFFSWPETFFTNYTASYPYIYTEVAVVIAILVV